MSVKRKEKWPRYCNGAIAAMAVASLLCLMYPDAACGICALGCFVVSVISVLGGIQMARDRGFNND